jgi:7-cyano-7-deazaguanine synthase in queuosine biosynthesis
MTSNNTITQCWTGGWDSTFRLHQLLHDTEVEIQPLYLVDEKRGSTPREIDVMRDIRSELKTQVPKFEDRLLPTDYGSYRATRMEPQHKEWWEALKEHGRVGLQYPILASYAHQNGIYRMEVCIQKHAHGDNSIGQIVDGYLDYNNKYTSCNRLKDNLSGPIRLFNRFAFPLVEYTKIDMRREVERRGWGLTMGKTWSCFNPILGLPCGHCTPCNIAQKEGMGSRVGWVGPALSKGKWLAQRLGKYPRRLASKLSG